MVLKITGPEFARLRAALEAEPVKIFARHHLEHYQKLHNTPGNPFYQRECLERWRWEVFYKASSHDVGLLQHLYTYLDDSNIAAALRKLLPGFTTDTATPAPRISVKARKGV